MAASVYSVGQVNSYIKNMFSQDFALKRISVRGEISNCKYHTTGHIYFTLKDASGVLSGVMFKSNTKSLRVRLENGMRVVATGSINVYERDGKYQIYAETIIPDGVGALYEQYELLKNKLEEMGMFDPSYKRPIPRYAKRIGVVTASTGAAIRDIASISARRNPGVTLYLYPALVQGAQASESIVHAISVLDQMGLDCIIVGRGGGSIEDLWAFNEEETAYAIFNAATPIISAVGHETDFTIADFVADKRAATPSAAAEIAVFEASAFEGMLFEYEDRLAKAMEYSMERRRHEVAILRQRLSSCEPGERLKENRRRLEELKKRLERDLDQNRNNRRNRLLIDVSRLEGNSPLKKLTGGFGYVTLSREGEILPVTKAAELEKDKEIRIRFSDGEALALVEEVSLDPGKEERKTEG